MLYNNLKSIYISYIKNLIKTKEKNPTSHLKSINQSDVKNNKNYPYIVWESLPIILKIKQKEIIINLSCEFDEIF